MRNLWLNFILFFFTLTLSAQNYERLSEYEQNLYGESVYVNGDYQTMKAVRAYWVKQAAKLKNRNIEFSLCGNAEGVLCVTIPTRILFQQNDTAMTIQAENNLRPFLSLLKGDKDWRSKLNIAKGGDNDFATCIVSCHSDNNGSLEYLSEITKKRAATIEQWMVAQGVQPTLVSSYGLANNVPRTKNENIRNRELNRRITLYFVPGKKMLKLAKKGKL